jgi:hypothetical protein
MTSGSYKVIYRERGKMRGENYTGKTHSLAKARELVEEHAKFSRKYKGTDTSSVKIVKVNRKPQEQFGMKLFGKMPRQKGFNIFPI